MSEEIKLKDGVQGALVWCKADYGGATDVKLFVRVKQVGSAEFDDFEEADGLEWYTDKTISHIQYAISLNTTDGKKTPSLSDVRITPGDELPPEEYTEKTAFLYVGATQSTKITYEH
jgi:hypothetical protein